MSNNLWKKNIKPYLKEIERWIASGMVPKEVSTKLNVSYSTFMRCAKKHPELKDAIKNGENQKARTIEKALDSAGTSIKKTPPPPMTTHVKEKGKRLDQNGPHRKAFERNKKRIYATQNVCGICGRPVDKSLKYPDPLSPCIDHIIPIAKGGHPSDISNLQLTHWTCNRQKSDKILNSTSEKNNNQIIISNRILPQSIDWTKYKAKK
ncbi:MAG: HNH endonuclease signature motif containing protein [Anaerovoracaceae bacterium]